jgi:hypothetical protein
LDGLRSNEQAFRADYERAQAYIDQYDRPTRDKLDVLNPLLASKHEAYGEIATQVTRKTREYMRRDCDERRNLATCGYRDYWNREFSGPLKMTLRGSLPYEKPSKPRVLHSSPIFDSALREYTSLPPIPRLVPMTDPPRRNLDQVYGALSNLESKAKHLASIRKEERELGSRVFALLGTIDIQRRRSNELREKADNAERSAMQVTEQRVTFVKKVGDLLYNEARRVFWKRLYDELARIPSNFADNPAVFQRFLKLEKTIAEFAQDEIKIIERGTSALAQGDTAEVARIASEFDQRVCRFVGDAAGNYSRILSTVYRGVCTAR